MARDPKKIPSYVLFDFETSGLDKKDGLHSQKCAATEIALIAINGVTLEEILRYDNLIKPYDENLEWQPGASNITGITKEKCINEGIKLSNLVDDLCIFFEEANIHNSKLFKPILVAHNGDFDKQFLQDIFRRTGKDLSKYVAGNKDHFGNFQPRILDTIDIAKKIEAEITDTDTKFSQEACCSRAGILLTDAHRAMNDVEALKDLFIYYIKKMRSSEEFASNNGDGKILNYRLRYEW